MHAEDGVFVEAELEQQPAAMTIFGNVRDAALAPRARIEAGQRRAFERHLAGDMRRIDQAGDRFDQLALAVAFDAGDADNLARPAPRTRRPSTALGFELRSGASPRDSERSGRRRPGVAGGFSTRSSTSRPTISRASSAAFVSLVFTRPTTFPSRITVTSSEIASTSAELVRDDDDRLSLLAHAAQDGEELLHFLRRQDRCRLVENQQPRVAVQRLQQLDALLLADRQILDDARAGSTDSLNSSDSWRIRAAASSMSSASARTGLGAQRRCSRRRSSCRPA